MTGTGPDPAFLAVRGVTKRFGGLVAVNDATLGAVPPVLRLTGVSATPLPGLSPRCSENACIVRKLPPDDDLDTIRSNGPGCMFESVNVLVACDVLALYCRLLALMPASTRSKLLYPVTASDDERGFTSG